MLKFADIFVNSPATEYTHRERERKKERERE